MFVGLKRQFVMAVEVAYHKGVKKRKYTGVPQQGAARYVVDCSEETTDSTNE